MSKIEKGKFKPSTKKQSVNKDYLLLFNLINRNTIIESASSLKEKYNKIKPQSSTDNTARYLYLFQGDLGHYKSAIFNQWYTKPPGCLQLYTGLIIE